MGLCSWRHPRFAEQTLNSRRGDDIPDDEASNMRHDKAWASVAIEIIVAGLVGGRDVRRLRASRLFVTLYGELQFPYAIS